jgi:TolB-like protein
MVPALRVVPLLCCLLALPSGAQDAQAPAPPPTERPRLFIRALNAQGVTPTEAAALTDAVVSTLADRALFRVISEKDVQTLLSTERERQLLGACGPDGDQDDARCTTDLTVALGAPFVLTGALSRVGTAYQLSLETLDVQNGQPLARSARLAGDLTTLTGLVPYAAAEATGSPLPPPRPRWLQYSMIGAGSGLLLGGGFYGLLALSREQALMEQICPGGNPSSQTCEAENLGYLVDARRQGAVLARDKTVSLGVMAAGALLAGAGIFLLPPPEAGTRVALVPTGRGAALAGVWW